MSIKFYLFIGIIVIVLIAGYFIYKNLSQITNQPTKAFSSLSRIWQ